MLWVPILFTPALLFFVKVYEERETVTGKIAFIDLGRAYLGILFMLFPLLPVISALLWIFAGHHQRQWKFHLAVWGLATVFIWSGFSGRLLTATLQFHPGRLWGLWL